MPKAFHRNVTESLLSGRLSVTNTERRQSSSVAVGCGLGRRWTVASLTHRENETESERFPLVPLRHPTPPPYISSAGASSCQTAREWERERERNEKVKGLDVLRSLNTSSTWSRNDLIRQQAILLARPLLVAGGCMF